MYPAVTFSGRSNNFGARLFFGGSGTLLYAPPTGYLPIHDYVVQKHHQKKETKRIRLLQLSLQTLNETFLYEYASVVVPNCLEELKRLASTSNASNKSVEVSFCHFLIFGQISKIKKKTMCVNNVCSSVYNQNVYVI